ncbi:unnamed protein product [Bursaphelenchus xylophilus]|uniref:(pine wood nematode) hypothetical protein n=1 Tax=Bursaphelenchus xylophilus TaxID=6326 RepID=A0A1I7SVM3_BURXY|nr:unnamed protein product [Bursaphelenchus xylophilus]CAG9101651.1 unnamed protein product [Bursaphelenchus xylophilus]
MNGNTIFSKETLKDLPFWRAVIGQHKDKRKVLNRLTTDIHEVNGKIELNKLALIYYHRYNEVLSVNELNYCLGLNENCVVDCLRQCKGVFRVRISEQLVEIKLESLPVPDGPCCLVQVTEKLLEQQAHWEFQKLCALKHDLGQGARFQVEYDKIKKSMNLDPDLDNDAVVDYIENVFQGFYKIEFPTQEQFFKMQELSLPPYLKPEREIFRNLKASRQYESCFISQKFLRVTLVSTGDFRRPILVQQKSEKVKKDLEEIMRKAFGYINELKANPVYLPREQYCCLLIDETVNTKVRRVQILRPLFNRLLCLDVDSGEFLKAFIHELFEAPPDFFTIPRLVEPMVFVDDQRGRKECMQKNPVPYFGPEAEMEADVLQRIFDAAFDNNLKHPAQCLGGPTRDLQKDFYTVSDNGRERKMKTFNFVVKLNSDDLMETGDILFPRAKGGSFTIRTSKEQEIYPQKLIADYKYNRRSFVEPLEVIER